MTRPSRPSSPRVVSLLTLLLLIPAGASRVRAATASGNTPVSVVASEPATRTALECRPVADGIADLMVLAWPGGGDATAGGASAIATPAPDAGAAGLALDVRSGAPTRGALTVAFTLPADAPATLELLDTQGRRLQTLELGIPGAGTHEARLDGERVPGSGVYFVRLRSAGRALTRRAVVLR